MIIDEITGLELIPGRMGKNCPGNSKFMDEYGNYIDCCNECDYGWCCYDKQKMMECLVCIDADCPRLEKVRKKFQKILKKVLTKRANRATIDKLSREGSASKW